MDEGSILEGDIRVNASLRFPLGDNVFHLQLELPGGRNLGIPGPTGLANYIQNVGRVGATIWFPIPALLQKHPDGIRDPWRCGIRRPPGTFPFLYLLQHHDVSIPTKWGLASQNLRGSETRGQGEPASMTYLVNHHPHPIDVTGLCRNNPLHTIHVRLLKLWCSPPPLELVESTSTCYDEGLGNREGGRYNSAMACICYANLAIAPNKDMFLRVVRE